VNRKEGLLQANISVFFARRHLHLKRFDLKDLLPEKPANCFTKERGDGGTNKADDGRQRAEAAEGRGSRGKKAKA
jgi:hypothetical protein